MKLYICGPMSGIADSNRPLFRKVEYKLRLHGYSQIYNPANVPVGTTWEDAMRIDIQELLTCQEIILLPGWSDSKGAKLEYTIASAFKMVLHDWRMFERHLDQASNVGGHVMI